MANSHNTAPPAKPPNQRQGLSKRRLRQLAVVSVVLALAYIAVTFSLDSNQLRQGLPTLSAGQWGILGLLSLINYALRCWRWHLYINHGDLQWQKPTVLIGILIYFAGFALTVTPGKAGEALRAVYLHDYGVPWRRSLAALSVERLLDLMALTLLAIGYFRGVFGGWGYGLVLGLTVLTIVWLLRSKWLYQWLLPRLARNQIGEGVGAVLTESRQLVSNRLLSRGLLLGILAWGVEAIGFFWLLIWLALPIGVAEASGIYAISLVAGALSFMPGGLGGAEATMVGLLVIENLSATTALLATLICRLVTLWFAVALGVLAVIALELGIGKRLYIGPK